MKRRKRTTPAGSPVIVRPAGRLPRLHRVPVLEQVRITAAEVAGQDFEPAPARVWWKPWTWFR